MTDDEFEELAAADAVGALGEDEQLLLEAEAARDPRRAEQLLEARLAAAAFADSVSEVAPPPQIREQLLTRLDADPARPRARRRWFALAAVVAGLAVVGGGAYAAVSQLSRPAAVVALDQIEKAGDAASASAELSGGGEVTLHWSAELGRAVMTADELPDIEDDRDYEMWFVRDDGPVSAGVFSEEDDAIALIDAEMHAGDVFAVTVEQAGGSESGLPTTDPFVVIATS